MVDVESPKNPRAVAAAKLHRRRQRRTDGLTVVEGPHLLADAVAAGLTVGDVFTLDPDGVAERAAAQAGATILHASERVLATVAGTKHPRGPVAIIEIPSSAPLLAQDCVVLAGVADPGNAGTVIRTAAAFGFAVVVAGGGVDVWAPKVVRAGAGAHFRTPITIAPADPTGPLTKLGVVSVALVARGGTDVDELGPDPVAFLVGSEPHGLPDALVAACDATVTLPMTAATESLNAAVAASIAMWSRVRNRP